MSLFKYNEDLDFLWDTVGDDLKNLSRDRLKEIMNDYYNNQIVVEKIVEKYNLSIHPSRLFLSFPKIKSNHTCEYDGNVLQISMPSRTAILSAYDSLDLTCPFCKHSPTNPFCNCKNCEKKHEEERKRIIEKQKNNELIKRDKIIKIYNPETKAKIAHLTLRDKLYFAALLRGLASEDLLKIMPYINRSENVTPLLAKDLKLLGYFCDTGYIKIDVYNSDINCFSDTEPITYYADRVIYQLNFDEDLSTKDLYKILRHPKSDKFLSNKEETLDLWRELAIDECIAYLNYQFKILKFPEFNAGEKTIDTFTRLLDQFSTGKIFSLIYSSVKSAAAYQRRDGVTVKRAQNSAITNINKYAARALDENWSLKNYDIPYNMENGCVTDILYDEILKLGSRGHNEIPSIEVLEDIKSKSDN